MNVPQYNRAAEQAFGEFEEAVMAAKDRFHKALTVARHEFFDDPDEAKATSYDEVNAHVRR